MIIAVDIDDTICATPSVNGVHRYDLSLPITHRIQGINTLYDEGHTIFYWTARGSSTGKDWESFTQDQLTKWGCKFHTLKMGKPSFDLYICDKSVNDEDFFRETDDNNQC